MNKLIDKLHREARELLKTHTPEQVAVLYLLRERQVAQLTYRLHQVQLDRDAAKPT